jgi:hypothetical protein
MVLTGAASAASASSGDGCLDWRWIAVAAGADTSCAVSADSGWRGQPLFSEDALGRSRDLGRFCRFEPIAPSADAARLKSATGNRFTRIDRDCAAAGGHAAPAAGVERWSAQAAELWRQSGADAVPRPDLVGPHRVRLAVVDSNPTNPIDPERDLGRSPHGNALVTLAQSLACAPGLPCSVAVTAQLGLAFVQVDPRRRDAAHQDAVNGGLLGSIADVAVAIDAELADWRARTPDHRLVLNLSLGWPAAYGGAQALPRDMPVPAQAVLAVLQDAGCAGALVFAAAGNRESGIDEEAGPLYPAAWESRPAPDAPACERLRGRAGTSDPSAFRAVYRPLLHAVGGIEADGAPLDNARPRSTPRLAAYGDHAVVESLALGAPPSGQPTATLTGSSVASLLAATNAAVAWSWKPAAGAHEIASLLHSAAIGTPSALGRASEVCLRDAAGRCVDGVESVHRLDLCLTRTASGPPIAGLSCAWQPSDPRLAIDRAGFDAGATVIDVSSHVLAGPQPGCGTSIVLVDPAAPLPATPCPHTTLLGIASRPWVMPQPGSDVCPHCEDTDEVLKRGVGKRAAAGSRVLRIEIAPRLSKPVGGMAVVVGDRVFVLATTVPVRGGDRFVVRGLSAHGVDAAALEHAFVAFAIDGRYAAVSPLFHED